MGIEATIDSPLARAVREVGSQSAFGRLVGKSQASVHELLRDGKQLWAEAVLTVEAATGVSRHDLRPDLYPREAPRAGDAGQLEHAR
jgi:DNA-binding transcriptional regulator YdaS (Cro superfamily)